MSLNPSLYLPHVMATHSMLKTGLGDPWIYLNTWIKLVYPFGTYYSYHLNYSSRKKNHERKKEIWWKQQIRPFLSCLEPPCESEARCKAFRVKINFVFIWINTNFHNKDYSRSLAFRMRLRAITSEMAYLDHDVHRLRFWPSLLLSFILQQGLVCQRLVRQGLVGDCEMRLLLLVLLLLWHLL